ncbi:unnamed protein product [Dibothriocephalus latus]|uniref:Uncharacterized protein n=1 Tax=Dibothriocephalus latus TaxID=60516 RepID=A0A3P7L8I0_DIBLA|nr:unnamed protein product [Dibothriocephalus latus]
MTATSNEMEGWPYMGEEWTMEDDILQAKRIADLLSDLQWGGDDSVDTKSATNVLLSQVWSDELKRGEGAWPPLRRKQEMHLQLLSFLRVACPQAWLVGSMDTTKGEFYQIIHTEPGDAPVANVPGPWPPVGGKALPRRFAFHGMDMLILTGREMGSKEGGSERQQRFRSYEAKLQSAFKEFIHGNALDPKCLAAKGGLSGIFLFCCELQQRIP